MHSPEIPTDIVEQVSQELGSLTTETTPGTYLEKYLRVRHGDIQVDVEEIGVQGFLLDVQRRPGGDSSPTAIAESAQRILKQEFNYDVTDYEITFPDGENDLNHYEINIKFWSTK